MEDLNTDAAQIERLVRSSTVHAAAVGDTPFILVPEGYALKDLESLKPAPRRVRETAKLATIESFIHYMTKWKNEATVIFADDQNRILNAVIDYHDEVNASWCDHKAVYATRLSREFTAWHANSNKQLPQIAFAEFIEEHIADVVTPAGADLLERALKLQVIQKAVFGSAVRLQTGEFQFNWSEENQKGTVEFPEKISLGIPLFHNGKAYKIEARLRYRLEAGKVTFTYRLVDIDAALEHAFDEVVSKVAAEVADVPIYSGGR